MPARDRARFYIDFEFANDLSPSSVYTHIFKWAEKRHNHFILNTLLYPHGIVRINKKHYEFTRKKTRHQRRSLCVNHIRSIRCRYIIIIQSPKYPFCHKIYRYQKRDLYGFFQSSLIYTPTPYTVTPSTAYLSMFVPTVVYVSVSILIF